MGAVTCFLCLQVQAHSENNSLERIWIGFKDETTPISWVAPLWERLDICAEWKENPLKNSWCFTSTRKGLWRGRFWPGILLTRSFNDTVHQPAVGRWLMFPRLTDHCLKENKESKVWKHKSECKKETEQRRNQRTFLLGALGCVFDGAEFGLSVRAAVIQIREQIFTTQNGRKTP